MASFVGWGYEKRKLCEYGNRCVHCCPFCCAERELDGSLRIPLTFRFKPKERKNRKAKNEGGESAKMGNLYCRSCGRQLDVIFVEDRKAFLADKKYEVGILFVDGKGTLWRVASIEKIDMGWNHKVEQY